MGKRQVRDQVEPAQLLGDDTSSEVHQPSNWVAGLQRHTLALVLCLLSIQAGFLAYSAKVHSPTWDEVGHLAAGLSHWELGRFELFSVNPPLVRTVASAPVYFFMQPQMDWGYYRSDPAVRSEVYLGRRMVELNGRESYIHFFVARLAVIPITLLGGLICFSWARDLFGPVAGLIALTLWTFSPNVIAYGSVITPDMASMVSLVGCSYVFWRWLKEPNWSWSLMLGAALTLAVLSKSVWLALPLVLFAIWGTARIFGRSSTGASGALPKNGDSNGGASINLQFSQLAIAGLLTLLMLNLFYGFAGSFQRLDEFEFVSESLAGRPVALDIALVDLDCPECDEEAAIGEPVTSNDPFSNPVPRGNRFTGSLFGALTLPVPANFIQGVDIQQRDFERGWYDTGWKSYLLGEWKHGGWWYYYIVGLAVKVPLATWLLIAVSMATSLVWRPTYQNAMGLVCLIVPAAAFFVLVSSTTGLNRYVRYALPVLPIMIIWASSIGRLLVAGDQDSGPMLSPGLRKFFGGVAATACLWLAVVSIYHNPNHLSYFNELAGGPENGHRFLCDSNIDWGQDLIAVEDWLEENPDAKNDFHLAYFGSFSPAFVGIESQLPPELLPDSQSRLYADQLWQGPQPGWHVVSKNYSVGHVMPLLSPRGFRAHNYSGEPVYRYFQMFKPVDRIGQSMLVYHLSQDDISRARSVLGLAPLPGIRSSQHDITLTSN